MRIPFFKAGRHTDSRGNVSVWTQKDLDDVVSAYNDQPEEKRHTAPIVLGHPKSNAPAYGWVKELFREGDMLYAQTEKEAPEFIEWLKKGLYRARSAAFYPDKRLRHIGFLGAQPPAIKGLPDFVFSEGEEYTEIELTYNINQKVKGIAALFRNIKNYFLAAGKNIEDAESIIPEWELENIAEELSIPEKEGKGGFCEADEEKKEENLDYEEKLKEKDAQIEALKREASQYAEAERARLEKERTEKKRAFLDKVKEKSVHKMTIPQQRMALAFAEGLPLDTDYEFEENGATVKKPFDALFLEFVESFPDLVKEGETAARQNALDSGEMSSGSDFSEFGEVDAEREALLKKAKALMKKDKELTLEAALELAAKEGK